MKDCVREYKYKGFLINFSEYRQVWTLEPIFLECDDIGLEFATEYNNECEGFKTINQAKNYIKLNEVALKNDVYKLYKEYKGE